MFSEIPHEVLTYLEQKAGCYEYREIYNSSQSLILEAASNKWVRTSNNNNRVVVKIQLLHSNALRRSFKREVKIHSHVDNSATHICTSLLKSKRLVISSSASPAVKHEVGVMIMEKMGMDLMDYMLNSEFIPISTIKMIFKVICQSVLECHKQGITHLDLKPENILLNLLGRAITDIKLCDFGCSFHHYIDENEINENEEVDLNHTHLPHHSTQRRKQSRRKIQSGRFGTLQYLPPECITHTSKIFNSQTSPSLFQLYTEKIDVYALGVILFMLVSKRFPKIYSESTCSVFCSLDSSNGDFFAFLSSYHGGCTVECANLVAWMMIDDAELRPSLSDVLSHPFFST